MSLKVVLSGLFLILAASTAHAQQVVKLTSTEWCPFTCIAEPEKGFGSLVVREAFKAAGVTAEAEYVPWLRAVEKAKNSTEVSGYFLAYPEEVQDGFVASPPMFSSRIGLALLDTKTAPSATVAALKGLKIGVVAGYGNSKILTDAIAAGLKTDEVPDDSTNIRKLAAGRIDAIEIDEFVLAHLLRTDPQLADARGKISFKLPLEEKNLHIAFAKTPLGQKSGTIFAEGLAKLNVEEMKKKHFDARR